MVSMDVAMTMIPYIMRAVRPLDGAAGAAL
jgi:hypothetical protein